MPLYGSTAGIKALLETEASEWPESQEARLLDFQKVVSILIEQETGATFGGDDGDITLAVEQYGGHLLFLPKGLRTLTSITAQPEWGLSGWTGGEVLDADTYRLPLASSNGLVRAIRRVGGVWGTNWYGTYLVTGRWEDQADTVPDDIHYLANYVSAEIFKKQQASPAGFVGPDGAVVPIRNVFKEPEVQKILDRHRVNAGLVFF